jgi:hypothetical protein
MLTSPRDGQYADPGFSYTDAEGNVVVEPPRVVTYARRASTVVGWELGVMQNHRVDRARGASLFLTVPVSEGGPQLGVRGRYRWWFASGAAVDVSPGVYLTHEEGEVLAAGEHRRMGASIRAAATAPGDWIALVAEVDLTPGHMGVQAGGRLGSVSGAVAGVAAPLATMLLYAMTFE